MSARQGADKHKLKARKDDLYETPSEAVHALMAVEQLPKVLWEPAAGRGAIARELRSAGHVVVMTDLVDWPGADRGIRSGVDFLWDTKPPFGVSTVVTNPPFKLADQFIRHGLDIGCTMIMLLRLMYIEGAGRSDLIDHHLVRIHAGIERLPMMHREGWEGPKIKSGGVPFAWFVFTPGGRPAGSAIELRRMSWFGHREIEEKPKPIEQVVRVSAPLFSGVQGYSGEGD